MDVVYSARLPEGANKVLVPGGILTPYGRSVVVDTPGLSEVVEATTGQRAYLMTPVDQQVRIRFRCAAPAGTYPDEMFVPHPSRFTRFAQDLITQMDQTVGDLTGFDLVRAVACHVAERFTYGHPECAFNDGFDEVPTLGCGLTPGSCVDINTYFIAALRSVGIDAGYVTGFFFPEEKNGTCEDGHCWVVTRQDGKTLEWDIAHHLKLGTREIQPGLNPKPGQRMACFHSMGLDFPDIGITELKALIEPTAIVDGRKLNFTAPDIRLLAVETV